MDAGPDFPEAGLFAEPFDAHRFILYMHRYPRRIWTKMTVKHMFAMKGHIKTCAQCDRITLNMAQLAPKPKPFEGKEN